MNRKKLVDFVGLNSENNLTEEDISNLVELIGFRCNKRTKQRLEFVLKHRLGDVKPFSILQRVTKSGFGWYYVACQSYIDEIRIIRGCLLEIYND